VLSALYFWTATCSRPAASGPAIMPAQWLHNNPTFLFRNGIVDDALDEQGAARFNAAQRRRTCSTPAAVHR
jgi:hypothetical protein